MKYSVLLLLVLSPIIAAAQDSASRKQLEEVVVTGQYKPQSVQKSVHQVKVISKERILAQGATNLQTVLSTELNIRFSQDLALGGSGITMLGLKGQNVKILLDGLPIIGRQGTSNEININQIDINTIERIEIIEGPMSVVYGADALAGVINIITKKNGGPKLSLQLRLQEETVGKEYRLLDQGIHNQSLKLSWKNKNWELGGGFSHNYFGGWKDTATDRELVWHKKDQLLAHGFIGFNKNKWSLRYRVDGLDEIITNPGNFVNYQAASGDTLAVDQDYLSKRIMQQIQAGYQSSAKLNIQLQASHTLYERQTYSTTVSKKTGNVRLYNAPGAQATVQFNGVNIRNVYVYQVSKRIGLQGGIDLNNETGTGERLKTGNNTILDLAAFFTGELSFGKRWNLKPGIRIIKNSVYQSPPLVPSLNAKFLLSSKSDLRFSYAQGFRAPSIRELYFDFFDANHQIAGNPDLKAETSNSFTASFNHKSVIKKGEYTQTTGVYFNSVKNMIDYGVSPQNSSIFTLLNIATSKTAGIQTNHQFRMKNWSIGLGGALAGFYNDYSANDAQLPELLWSPELNGNFNYKFAKTGIDLNLFVKYTGKRPYYIQDGSNYELSKMDAYTLADLSLGKTLFKYVQLSIGARNLFNTTTIRSTLQSSGVHASNGNTSIATGRSYFINLIYNFNK